MPPNRPSSNADSAPPLLDDCQLERSSVVANARMNRTRGLHGIDSYQRELGIDPLVLLEAVSKPGLGATARLPSSEKFDTALLDQLAVAPDVGSMLVLKPLLGERQDQAATARWLDLCCGSGLALIEAARCWQPAAGRPGQLSLHGVDLIAMFAEVPAGLGAVTFEAASLARWQTPRRYDLITCVHGLHYLGDKLGLIERAITWLTPGGVFLANLDVASLRRDDGKPLGRRLLAKFRAGGFDYDRRAHVLSRTGNATFSFGLRYVGADDQAGANYTGQEAVDSYYGKLNRPTCALSNPIAATASKLTSGSAPAA
ncbi:MAG: trans-aconitate 2-methyltransferase [Pirellulales bacterium]